MFTPANRRPNRIAAYLIRIALVAAFAFGAAGSVEASSSGDGASADVAGGKATPILFSVRVGTTGGGDGSQ